MDDLRLQAARDAKERFLATLENLGTRHEDRLLLVLDFLVQLPSEIKEALPICDDPVRLDET